MSWVDTVLRPATERARKKPRLSSLREDETFHIAKLLAPTELARLSRASSAISQDIHGSEGRKEQLCQQRAGHSMTSSCCRNPLYTFSHADTNCCYHVCLPIIFSYRTPSGRTIDVFNGRERTAAFKPGDPAHLRCCDLPKDVGHLPSQLKYCQAFLEHLGANLIYLDALNPQQGPSIHARICNYDFRIERSPSLRLEGRSASQRRQILLATPRGRRWKIRSLELMKFYDEIAELRDGELVLWDEIEQAETDEQKRKSLLIFSEMVQFMKENGYLEGAFYSSPSDHFRQHLFKISLALDEVFLA